MNQTQAMPLEECTIWSAAVMQGSQVLTVHIHGTHDPRVPSWNAGITFELSKFPSQECGGRCSSLDQIRAAV